MTKVIVGKRFLFCKQFICSIDCLVYICIFSVLYYEAVTKINHIVYNLNVNGLSIMFQHLQMNFANDKCIKVLFQPQTSESPLSIMKVVFYLSLDVYFFKYVIKPEYV